jgi:hypothetical protein
MDMVSRSRGPGLKVHGQTPRPLLQRLVEAKEEEESKTVTVRKFVLPMPPSRLQ